MKEPHPDVTVLQSTFLGETSWMLKCGECGEHIEARDSKHADELSRIHACRIICPECGRRDCYHLTGGPPAGSSSNLPARIEPTGKPESIWPSECSPEHLNEQGMVVYSRDKAEPTYQAEPGRALHPIFDREYQPNPNYKPARPTNRNIPERQREYGPPNPALIIGPGDHIDLTDATAVQVWRLKQMLDGVLAKIPPEAFIVGFEFKLAVDVDGKPFCKSASFGQFCDNPPLYPNIDQIRKQPGGG